MNKGDFKLKRYSKDMFIFLKIPSSSKYDEVEI
jgi:hypothetical protein